MTPVPLQITFDGLAHSDEMEAEIRECAAWLERFDPRILGCRVHVEVPHRHQRRGRQFHVRIDIAVPGGEPIVVSHHPSLRQTSKAIAAERRKETEIEQPQRDVDIAIHKAFAKARRRLQDFVREQREEKGLEVGGSL